VAALEDARAAKTQLAEALAGHPAVNGVGVAPRDDGYELKVDLREAVEPGTVPDEVAGVPVRAVVVGEISAG